MDKRSIIGLVLIGVILIGFIYYNSRKMSDFQKEQAKLDSVARVNAPKAPVDTAKAENGKPAVQQASKDSVEAASIAENVGSEMLAQAIKGTEEQYTLQNDLIKVTFSNKGARISSVEALKYKRYNGDKLVLFTPDKSQFDIDLFIGQSIATSKFYFTPVNVAKNATLGADSSKSAVFRLYADADSYIEYVYTLKKDSYLVDYKINFVGMQDKFPANMTSFDIKWAMDVPQQEKGFENENRYTAIAYKTPGKDGDFEELNAASKTGEEKITTKIRWVDFKQQFFSSIILADNNFIGGDVSQTTNEPNSGYIKNYSAKLSVAFAPSTPSVDLAFYFGPNLYNELKKYDEGFEEVVPLGGWIIRWINRWLVIPTFDFLDSSIASFGIIILILTVLIKLLLFPLTFKSYKSMAKMRVLKPEVDKINERFPKKEDAMKKQQEVMALYKKTGVNPMGGCLPLLIQFPFLIAMFRFFPASFELRQEHFLWADDLSSYDSIANLPFDIPLYGSHISLFTILMAVALYASSKINMSQMGDTSNQQIPGMKFMTLYMMPIMMIFWFNNYSAALSYYYFLSSLITLLQTYIFRQTLDDKKVLAQMRENSKKPVKKSKFQMKLEEMARQQQQQQRKR